jgi:hypothetical protein
MRRLRAANRATTLNDAEAANVANFCPPEVAADMTATFRQVWLEMRLESPGT